MSRFPASTRLPADPAGCDLRGVPVAVTGAGGFVGSHLAEQLVMAGARVHCLVRSAVRAVRLERLAALVAIQPVELTDAAAVHQIIQRHRPDVVFHLAGNLDAALGQRAYDRIVAANVESTVNITRASRDAGVQRLVLAGSCAEYQPSEQPLDERSPLRPSTPYAASKTAAWALALGLCAGSRTAVCTIRLFTPYGPWERLSRFVPGAITHCLDGRPFPMTLGTQARDYLHVDDAARAFLLAGSRRESANAVINVGSGEEIEIRHLADLIAQLTGQAASIFRRGAVPSRAIEFYHQRAAIAEAQRLLGWSPQVSLRQGLCRTIAWYRDHRHLLDRLEA